MWEWREATGFRIDELFSVTLIVHTECWSLSQHFSGPQVGCSTSDKAGFHHSGRDRETDTSPSNNPYQEKVPIKPSPLDSWMTVQQSKQTTHAGLGGTSLLKEAVLTTAPLSWPAWMCLLSLALPKQNDTTTSSHQTGTWQQSNIYKRIWTGHI